jgi:hypothetical protein
MPVAVALHRRVNTGLRLENSGKFMMNKAVIVAALAILASGGLAVSNAAAASAPCEEMLKDMRAAKATAKLNDADMAKVNDLETKAIERCNADDDTRSDKFLTEAMTIMGK